MSDTTKTEFTLSEDMKAGMDEADGWVRETSSVLGFAFLEHEEARLRYELAQKNLSDRAATTRQAEVQRGHVLKKMAAMLNLGPGEWVYDGAGKLVRKDIENAKSP